MFNFKWIVSYWEATPRITYLHTQLHMSRIVRKRTFGHVRPAEIPISLCILTARS